MSTVSTIRSAQPWQRAAVALTMVPLLLWSSLSSFGYLCREGRYEPFCLALDCCGGAESRPNSTPHLEHRGGPWRAPQGQANRDAGRLATVDGWWAAQDATGSGFGHESSCQPVLKQPGSNRVDTWETGRGTQAANPLCSDCNAGLVAAATLTVEAAPVACRRADRLLAVLQRLTI
jgi:hypothetical protein